MQLLGMGSFIYPDFSITKDIHIGDLVELLVDGKFFDTPNGRYERYSGYIASIRPSVIGVSQTHHNNKYHRYVEGVEGKTNKNQSQSIVEIETRHIKEYRILNNSQSFPS